MDGVEFWISYCGVKRIQQEILFVSIFSLFLNQTDNSLKENTESFEDWPLEMMRDLKHSNRRIQ